MLNAAKLAVAEVNSAGGVLNGRLLELVVRNDHGIAASAEEETRDLMNEGVVALTGYIASSRTLEAASLAAEKQVPVLSCCATSDQLTSIPESGDGYFFRIVPPDSLQAPVVARAATDILGCSRMAVLYYDDAYGKPFAPLIVEAVESGGGEVVSVLPIIKNSGTFLSTLRKAEAETPECVAVIALGEDVARIIEEWDADIGRKVGWLATDAALDGSLLTEISPTLLDGIVVTAPDFFPNRRQARAVQSAYRQAYGREAPEYSLGQFDIIAALALAIEHAGTDDPSVVRDSLFSVTRPGGFRVEPGIIHEGFSAIHRGSEVDYQGASGVVDFDPCGNVVTDYMVLQYKQSIEDFELYERISLDEGAPCPRADL